MPSPAIQTKRGFVSDEPTLCTIIRSASSVKQEVEDEVLSVYQQGLSTLEYHDLDLLLHIQGYEQEYEDQREAYQEGDRRKPPKALSLAEFRRYYCPTSDLKRRLDPLEEMGLVELAPMPLPGGDTHGKKKTPFLTKKGWDVLKDICDQLEKLAQNVDEANYRDLTSAVQGIQEE
jgi:hypothetical protein